MRNGIEVWMDSEKALRIGSKLEKGAKGLLKAEDRYLNSVDIIGIFSAADMDEQTRRKNGQWKCKHDTWHDKGVTCLCRSKVDIEKEQARQQAWERCGKCWRGYVTVEENVTKFCVCQKGLV